MHTNTDDDDDYDVEDIEQDDLQPLLRGSRTASSLQPPKTPQLNIQNTSFPPEIIGLLDYIINQSVSEKVYKNAGKDSIRDKGRAPGTCLKDFMQNENAIKGNLNELL